MLSLVDVKLGGDGGAMLYTESIHVALPQGGLLLEGKTIKHFHHGAARQAVMP